MTPLLPNGYKASLEGDSVGIRHGEKLLFAASFISQRRPSVWICEDLTEADAAVVKAFVKAIWNKEIPL